MDEARNGTTHYIGSAAKTGDGKDVIHRPGIIDFVKDQGNYQLESTSRPAGFDTDKDGIPDEWEKANGLNPNDAADAMLYTIDKEKQWYTNLEVYANSLVEDIMKAGNADATSTVEEYYPEYKTPTAIRTVYVQPAEAPAYNLKGQRISEGYKGIVIRNGKKIMIQ